MLGSLYQNPPAIVRSGTVTRQTGLTTRVGLGTASPVVGRKVHALETGADSGYRAEGNNAGDVALDALVTGDAAARYTVLLGGFMAWGDGAGAADTQLFRGAADRLDVGTGDSLNLVSGTFLIGSTVIFEADRDVAITLLPNADGTLGLGSPTRRWHLSAATVNFGDGAANDVQLSRGAANRLDLASGDSLNIVLGDILIGATTLFESDRDLAVDLVPNASGTLDLGSTSREFVELHARNWISGEVSPAQIVANVDNYAGADGYSFARIETDAARDITGIDSGEAGRMLTFANVGAQNVRFMHQAGSSAVENRIICAGGVTQTLTPNQTITFRYDGTTQRWRQTQPVT